MAVCNFIKQVDRGRKNTSMNHQTKKKKATHFLTVSQAVDVTGRSKVEY